MGSIQYMGIMLDLERNNCITLHPCLALMFKSNNYLIIDSKEMFFKKIRNRLLQGRSWTFLVACFWLYISCYYFLTCILVPFPELVFYILVFSLAVYSILYHIKPDILCSLLLTIIFFLSICSEYLQFYNCTYSFYKTCKIHKAKMYSSNTRTEGRLCWVTDTYKNRKQNQGIP